MNVTTRFKYTNGKGVQKYRESNANYNYAEMRSYTNVQISSKKQKKLIQAMTKNLIGQMSKKNKKNKNKRKNKRITNN